MISTREMGYRLLGIVLELAPTGKDQELIAEYYREAMEFGDYEKAVLMLVDILNDGMRYGNWPWALKKTP